jgi:hypothetical protein
MEEIPVALQTDRILAPRPEFTKIVMQQVIVRQKIGLTLNGTWAQPISSQTSGPSAEEPEKAAKLSSKIVYQENRPSYRPKNASAYVLRFSSLAAVAVVIITLGVYVLAQSPGDLPNTTAAVYGSIQNFADTVRNALSNPLDLVAGIILAVIIMISLWRSLVRPNRPRR